MSKSRLEINVLRSAPQSCHRCEPEERTPCATDAKVQRRNGNPNCLFKSSDIDSSRLETNPKRLLLALSHYYRQPWPQILITADRHTL
jgi:hypothetical protein